MAKSTAKKSAPKKAAASKSLKKASPKAAPAYKNTDGEETKLSELFLDSLKDIYWAEKHLTKALPKMKKAATSTDLANAFDEHLAITQTHISRLEQVFEILGKKPQAKKCEAMEGLTKEGEEIIKETDKGTKTRDVGLIMAAQKVEHYEIATYGSLATLASMMGQMGIKRLLGQTLEEEKETDATLTELAEGHINEEAMGEGK